MLQTFSKPFSEGVLLPLAINVRPGSTERGKYHCTVDLLFDWFGLVCFANKNKNGR
jgi:hypothetical protein